MKKILFIGFFLIFGNAIAQKDWKAEIKALKIAYITEHLDLQPSEAEKFWPVYNKFDEANRDLRREHRNIHCSLKNEATTKAESQNILQEYIALEDQRCLLRKQMMMELSGILPPQKIVHLKEVEDDFHRELLKEYRSRKQKKD